MRQNPNLPPADELLRVGSCRLADAASSYPVLKQSRARFSNPFRHIRHCKTSGKLSPSSDLPPKAGSDKLLTMHNLAICAGLCKASRWGSSPAAPAIFISCLFSIFHD